MAEVFLGSGDNLTVQTSKNVELKETLYLVDDDQNINLEITITADFENIPEKYHEIFINMMTTKYYGRVSFGHNPFSQCLPPKNKKWYHIWKR